MWSVFTPRSSGLGTSLCPGKKMIEISVLSNLLFRVMMRLVEAICEEVNRLYCCIQRMNSNGCVQAWVDIKCIEASLKPYINKTSAGFIGKRFSFIHLFKI